MGVYRKRLASAATGAVIAVSAFTVSAPAHAEMPERTAAYSCLMPDGNFLAQVSRYDHVNGTRKTLLTAFSDGGSITMLKVLDPQGKVLASRTSGRIILSERFLAKHPSVTVWARIKKASPTSYIPSCTTDTIKFGPR